MWQLHKGRICPVLLWKSACQWEFRQRHQDPAPSSFFFNVLFFSLSFFNFLNIISLVYNQVWCQGECRVRSRLTRLAQWKAQLASEQIVPSDWLRSKGAKGGFLLSLFFFCQPTMPSKDSLLFGMESLVSSQPYYVPSPLPCTRGSHLLLAVASQRNWSSR